MIYFHQTQRGRVVYDRKPHLITSSDAARFVNTAYTREINNLLLHTEDDRWKLRLKWNFIARLGASGHEAVCRTLSTYLPGALMSEALYGANTATIISLIEVYEALRSVLDFITNFGALVPYVGQTATIGQGLIDGLLLILGPMPPYIRDENGHIVLI